MTVSPMARNMRDKTSRRQDPDTTPGGTFGGARNRPAVKYTQRRTPTAVKYTQRHTLTAMRPVFRPAGCCRPTRGGRG